MSKKVYRELAKLRVEADEAKSRGSSYAGVLYDSFQEQFTLRQKELDSNFDAKLYERAVKVRRRFDSCRTNYVKRQLLREQERLREEALRTEEEELARRIYKHAEDYAHGLGRRLGQGVDQEFRNLASRAAADLMKIPAISRDGWLNMIRLSFEQMIGEMIAASKSITGYDQSLIGEETLARARRKLCPLYPFC